jgi:LMBR1 domain-containing protein 1
MAIVCGILLLIASVYILAIYCHPEDAGFGSSLYCKFLVVSTSFLFLKKEQSH